jgi:GT2 family glycosyltransferase
MPTISVSIVLYHNDIKQIKRAIESALSTSYVIKLYLIDNSTTDCFGLLSDMDQRITYIQNLKNIGYGSAHNIAIRDSILNNFSYHLVINPDIYFDAGVLESLLTHMEGNHNVGNISPKTFYMDGELQYLSKLLPTPMDLLVRRFIPIKSIKNKIDYNYELKHSKYNKIMNVPNLSGCFMFLRIEALKKVGIFDENFFMYLEDVDLNRRLHQQYETIFYPFASIVHGYDKGSYKSYKLLVYHIKSAFYYFNKWGWFSDKGRRQINCTALKKI